MPLASSTARLVDAGDLGQQERGVMTILPRDEIEEALRSENGAPELLLDIERAKGGDAGKPDVEAHTLKVVWDRSDLEKVLRTTEGDRVVLTFDRDELEEALEADVEAHGLREKAAILSVAALTATGIAASQAAAVPDFGGAAPATVTGVAAPSEEATGLPDLGGSPATVTGGAVPSAETTGLPDIGGSPATVTGGAVPSAGLPDLGSSPAEVTGGAVPSQPATAPDFGGQSPAEVTGGAVPSGRDIGATQLGMPHAGPADWAEYVGAPGGEGVPASESGGGPSLSGGEAAAVAAGLAGLAITAAGFAATRGRRRVEPA